MILLIIKSGLKAINNINNNNNYTRYKPVERSDV